MNQFRFIPLATGLWVAIGLGSASAENGGTSSEAAHIVDSVYQIVYVSVDMCKRFSPKEADVVLRESSRFKQAYPDFINAVERSPYFSQAKTRWDGEMLVMTREAKKDPMQFTSMCQESVVMLKQFVDRPSGKEGVEDMLLRLRK